MTATGSGMIAVSSQPTCAIEMMIDVRHGVPAVVRILPGRPQPEQDLRHAHDDVAEHHEEVVRALAVRRPLEADGESVGEHDHADHLHDRPQTGDQVVVVVGRGEPGEVQPRPGDRPDGEHVGAERRPDVAVGELLGQLIGGGGEGDHVGEVVEQLERRRAAPALARVATAHRADPVAQLRPQVVRDVRHAASRPSRAESGASAPGGEGSRARVGVRRRRCARRAASATLPPPDRDARGRSRSAASRPVHGADGRRHPRRG